MLYIPFHFGLIINDLRLPYVIVFDFMRKCFICIPLFHAGLGHISNVRMVYVKFGRLNYPKTAVFHCLLRHEITIQKRIHSSF